jgi:hypothetical protein
VNENYVSYSNKIIQSISLIKNNNNNKNFSIGDDLVFSIELREALGKNRLDIGIYDKEEIKVTNLSTTYSNNKLETKKHISCVLSNNCLSPGQYSLNLAVLDFNKVVEYHEKIIKFEILSGDFFSIGKIVEKVSGKFFMPKEWI